MPTRVIVPVAIVLVCCASAVQAASIYVSGFNTGEVFGAGANPNGTVTGDVDGSSSYWTGAGYNDGTQTVGQGLPTGPFLSATSSGQTYQFQPFNVGSDALRGGGTISVTPGQYADVYLLGTGGGGNGIANVTLNFSDSTSTTFASGLANHDWGNSATNLAVSAQRTRPGTVTGAITSGTWNIFESTLFLSPADEHKTLLSITIAPLGNGVSNVYAVNGILAPEPATFALFGLGAVGLFAASRRRRRNG